MADDSTRRDSTEKRHTGRRWLLGITGAIVLFILTAVVFGGGVYLWQQHRYNQLNDKFNALQQKTAQLQRLNAHNQTQPAPQMNGNTAAPAHSGTTVTSQKGVKAVVYVPEQNATVSSPVGVVGQIPGNWSNEAQFPVQLKDASGKVIATGTAHVLGDWMTDQLRPFSVQLTYSGTQSGSGTLVLQKDNPSGQAGNDDQISIPVKF